MGTDPITLSRSSPMAFLEQTAIADLRAALGVIPPSRHDLEALLDAWDAEDKLGDLEEQQRSLDLLMQLLEDDRP